MIEGLFNPVYRRSEVDSSTSGRFVIFRSDCRKTGKEVATDIHSSLQKDPKHILFSLERKKQ